MDPQFKARLVAADTTLNSLQDDKGLDLLKQANGRGIDQFWEANKKLRVLTSPDGTRSGLQLNAPNTPSAGASKLVAEGSLSFVALDNRATLEHGEVKLTTGETVKTGAAQLKFSKGNGPGGEGGWWMELRPGPEALDVAVELFGDDEKVPLFDSDGGRTATRRMNGVVSYGFQCPPCKLSRVEIAYAKKGGQIEVPFKVEIGLGDFSGVEQDQEQRRPGPGPRPTPNNKPKGVI